MKKYLIIDGYNFLHAQGMIPAQKKVTPVMLEQSRQLLYQLLVERLSDAERERTTIVFDVRRNRGGVPERRQIALITVYSAVNDHDADTLIERLLDEHREPHQLMVVTNDRRLKQAARAARASCLDCEEFYQQLITRKKRTPNIRPIPESAPPVPLPAKKDFRGPQPPPAPFPDLVPEELEYWEKRIQELDHEP